MGFLDQLANLSPEQNQGLLTAAAQILQQSGPSRMPTSFGQILGGGLQAYQGGVSDAQKRKLEELLGQQTTQMNSYKLRDAESDFANQEAQRQRAEQLRQFYIKQGGGAQPSQASSSMGATPAPAIQGASVAPQTQSVDTPSAGNQSQGVYQQRMALASQLRNAGFSQEADAQEAAALKFQPAVDSWESIRSGGKIYKKPYFKDGTSGDFIPAEVAEKLDKVNIGGKTLLTGEMSGNTYQTFNNSIDPNTSANNAVAIRGQNMTDARAREANMSGKAPAGYRWAVNGELEAIPGGPASKAATATEGERKAATLLMRLQGSEAQLEDALRKNSSAATPGLAAQGLRSVGADTLANSVAVGPERQRVEAAQLDILDAALTLGTGAAYTKEQLEGYRKSYFPQIGDKPATVKDKQDRLNNVIEAAKIAAGRAGKAIEDPRAPPSGKTISLADIAETARKSGKTTAEVTAAARAKGYKIGGQ